MDKKKEVKKLLEESGHGNLFTEENYKIASSLTKIVEKQDVNLKTFFQTLEGMREKYIHDLIVMNKK